MIADTLCRFSIIVCLFLFFANNTLRRLDLKSNIRGHDPTAATGTTRCLFLHLFIIVLIHLILIKLIINVH